SCESVIGDGSIEQPETSQAGETGIQRDDSPLAADEHGKERNMCFRVHLCVPIPRHRPQQRVETLYERLAFRKRDIVVIELLDDTVDLVDEIADGAHSPPPPP